MTGFALKQHLASLLDQKSSQLQVLGTMGQEILRQQQDLEERIRLFNAEDAGGEEEVSDETMGKLRELDQAVKDWENQNKGMMRELGGGQVSGEVPSITYTRGLTIAPRGDPDQSHCPRAPGSKLVEPEATQCSASPD